MKRFTSLFLTLVILSLTASYGQTSESLTCYNNEELQQIAARVVRANECDTLLDIEKLRVAILQQTVAAKDSIISAKDSVIDTKDGIIQIKEDLIDDQFVTIDQLNKTLNRQVVKNKLLKLGWIGSSVVFLGYILFR